MLAECNYNYGMNPYWGKEVDRKDCDACDGIGLRYFNDDCEEITQLEYQKNGGIVEECEVCKGEGCIEFII